MAVENEKGTLKKYIIIIIIIATPAAFVTVLETYFIPLSGVALVPETSL